MKKREQKNKILISKKISSRIPYTSFKNSLVSSRALISWNMMAEYDSKIFQVSDKAPLSIPLLNTCKNPNTP